MSSRLLTDPPGHESDQPCTCFEEKPGAVCLQSKGHADAQQLSGGLLDRQFEESQPEGRRSLNSYFVSPHICATHKTKCHPLQGEEILSQMSQGSDDEEEGQGSPAPQEQSGDEVT